MKKNPNQDLKEIMSYPAGRRFIAEMLESSQVFGGSFALDPCQHAFNAGRKAFAVSLLARLQIELPEDYLVMERERLTRKPDPAVDNEDD